MSISHSPSGNKTYFTTSNRFEYKFGYHRAVRKGPFIFVSGTTALNPETGKIDHPGDAYQQALSAMKRSVDAVQQLGGARQDVTRVRMFVAVRRLNLRHVEDH
jgi:enamine deaminase RidA (YjgF/YER057c/UK114 family)